MGTIGIFRGLTLATLASFVATALASVRGPALPAPVAEYLNATSAGSLGAALHAGNFGTKLLVSILLALFLIGYMAALLGMMRFRRWARVLFIFIVPLSLILEAAMGVNIVGPLQSVVMSVGAMCQGAVLVLLFVEPVRARFRESPAAPATVVPVP